MQKSKVVARLSPVMTSLDPPFFVPPGPYIILDPWPLYFRNIGTPMHVIS